MSEKPENPPAFPHVLPHEWRYVEPGMTLRDYFAASALAALLHAEIVQEVPEQYATITAKAAYGLADAMLKARAE